MKQFCVLILALFASCSTLLAEDDWVSLLNGVNIDVWKVSERQEAVSVKDGIIVLHGERSHLFYMGNVNHHLFTNVELKAKVLTKAIAGIYFHTEYQEIGWPLKGYECQINNTQRLA